MNDPQHSVAFHHGIHDNPHRQEIVKLIHRKVLAAHFFVDAVEMFGPAGNIDLDSRISDFLLENIDGPLDDILPLGKLLFYSPPDFVIGIRIQSAVRKILKLPLDMIDSQAMRQGSIDFLGLPGDAHLLLLGEHPEGTHVVQPIPKLDENHPDILGHNEKHLSKIFRLIILEGLKVNASQLGYTAYEKGHVPTETLGKLLFVKRRIFQDIVKQGRHKGFHVQPHIRKHRSHREGMHDIGLSGMSALFSMSSGRKNEAFPQENKFFPGKIGRDLAPEILPSHAHHAHPLGVIDSSDKAVSENAQILFALTTLHHRGDLFRLFLFLHFFLFRHGAPFFQEISGIAKGHRQDIEKLRRGFPLDFPPL